MAKNEEWKPVKGFEKFYEISNKGNIKSIGILRNVYVKGTQQRERKNIYIQKDELITPHDNGNGYLMIVLRKHGKRYPKYIHRLVAEAFVPNPLNVNVVNHKDFNKRNNNAENLEWCTQKENICYSRERMAKPKNVVGKSGEKYISVLKNGKYYVYYRKAKINRTFKTLDDAIAFRNEVFNEIGIAI